MNIAAIGSIERLEELNFVLSLAGLSFTRFESTKNIINQKFDVIFDLNFDDRSHSISDYIGIQSETILFLSSVKIQLEAHIPSSLSNQVIGMNALPTFIKRDALECCVLNEKIDLSVVQMLGWAKTNLVKSRVGLVSPRVILMIINEAYFTLEEGTANRVDIDLGMKLGTAYPFGPFEWCDKIGINNVYESLVAIKNDSGDERYKICNSLKTDYLKFKQNAC
ncbi:MAG: 3-hydroxyacyl-CoA dehydrogenase family protein [Bacteroidota bacterium]|nr:3-hydroxyacyl-CoA dehydrogenase family protein [Bacteroidota bacterium]